MLAAGFVPRSPVGPPSSFISDYINLVRTNVSPGEIVVWMIRDKNASRMKETMFFEPIDWQLESFQVLALRALAPKGVFTPTGKSGYLTRVVGKPALLEIADTIFATDFEFATKVSPEIRAVIVELMEFAYRYGIRPEEDPRVKSLKKALV